MADEALLLTNASSAGHPLLIDIKRLATLLCRSVVSLRRDDAAGRLPAALRIGSSKRWRRVDIEEWIAMRCPARKEFEAKQARRP